MFTEDEIYTFEQTFQNRASPIFFFPHAEQQPTGCDDKNFRISRNIRFLLDRTVKEIVQKSTQEDVKGIVQAIPGQKYAKRTLVEFIKSLLKRESVYEPRNCVILSDTNLTCHLSA